MIKRRISKEIYIISFIITAGIFALGLLLGLFVENQRVGMINEKERIQALELRSLQLQYQFINVFSEEDNCGVLSKAFDDSVLSLEKTRERIENYVNDAAVNEYEFELLKREYSLSQINYWLLAERVKKTCENDVVTLLYFYGDEKQCPDCSSQGVVLTYLKNKFGMKLLNFVFDGNTEEPMIQLLKKVYSVDTYPTLIIDGKKYSGFTDKENLLKVICPKYNEFTEVCEDYIDPFNIAKKNQTSSIKNKI